MEEDKWKNLAQQLRCPDGEDGIETALLMNDNNKKMTESAIENMHLQDADCVLEIGHGNAQHLSDLLAKANNIQYQGADISETMVSEAKKINTHFINNGRASFNLTDGENLPFEDHTFDKVFTVNTLYFWKNPTAYMQEIERVLKPQGMLCLVFATAEFMEQLPFTSYGFTLYTLKDAHDLVTQAGFILDDIIPTDEEITAKSGEAVQRSFISLLAKKQ